MKFMRFLQKLTVFFLIPSILAACCSCVSDKRFDYSELNIRLGKSAPRYVFSESGMFCSGGVYYCYYSLNAENDMLLTLKEDEKGKLNRISLTLDIESFEESAGDFSLFSLALAEIFIPDADMDSLARETGIKDFSLYSSDVMKSYAQGFYKAALFGSREAACFMLFYG